MRKFRVLAAVVLTAPIFFLISATANGLSVASMSFSPLGPTGSPWGQVGKVSTVAVDWSHPTIIYAAGGGWSTIDSNPDPNSSGVFLTRDGGAHWTSISAGLPDTFVYSLWVDPTAPNHAVAVSVLGVSETSNWGQSWVMTLPRTAATVAPYQYHADSISNIGVMQGAIYVANGPSIYRSNNAGLSWAVVHTLASGNFVYLAANGSEVCATWAGGHVDCSTAPGTWLTKTVTPCGNSCDVEALWLGPATSHEMVLGTGAQWMSVNDGLTWHPFPRSALWAGQFQAMTLDPQHANVVWAADVDGPVYKSSDFGVHWIEVYSGGDMRSIIPPPPGANLFFLGTDQGLYRGSSPALNYVVPISQGVRSAMAYDVAAAGNNILTVVQDYSPFLSTNGGRTWVTTSGGENGLSFINPAVPQVMLQDTNNYGSQSYFSDVGTPFLNVSSAPQPPLFTKIVSSTSNPNIVYGFIDSPYFYSLSRTGTSYLWRSTNWGLTWHKVEQLPGEMIDVALNPSNPLSILAIQKGVTSNSLWSSTDGGRNWSPLSPDCQSMYGISQITWNPSNPLQVAITSRESANVCESNDGGQSFVNVAGEFLAKPVPATDPTSIPNVYSNVPSLYFVLGDSRGSSFAIVPTSGLFYSPAFGSPWTRVTTNLVAQNLTSLAWLHRHLVLSTYGEGVVESSRVATPFNVPATPTCLHTTVSNTTTTFHWRSSGTISTPPVLGFVLTPVTATGRYLTPQWVSPLSRSLSVRTPGKEHLRALIASDNVVGVSSTCTTVLR